MKNMVTQTRDKFVRVTSKGQITLPVSYRNAVGTDSFVMSRKGRTLEIKPALVFDDDGGEWGEAIFDADRDNGGKLIRASELLTLFKKYSKRSKAKHLGDERK